MCRHHNHSQAWCLFGRPPLRPLLGHPDARAFMLPEDAEWLAGITLRMDVRLRP